MKVDNKLISDFVAALEQLSSPELVLKVSNTRTYAYSPIYTCCTHVHVYTLRTVLLISMVRIIMSLVYI